MTAKEKLNSNYINQKEKWLLAQSDKFKPDLVLALTQIISTKVLSELKRKRIATVAWWGDSPANMTNEGLLSDLWDFIYLKDPQTVEKFKRVGINTELLHEAMNPDWHKPVARQKNNKIVVAGNFYAYRNFLVSKLLDKNIEVDLYGRRLPIWADKRIKEKHTGKYITKIQKSIAFGEGLACLNSTHVKEGNAMNLRAFEIAGASGLQIMENREIISDCFEPGKEILVFNHLEELYETIDFAKNHPKEAQKIRHAGHKRALSDHTYEKRLNYILSKLL